MTRPAQLALPRPPQPPRARVPRAPYQPPASCIEPFDFRGDGPELVPGRFEDVPVWLRFPDEPGFVGTREMDGLGKWVVR